MTNVTSKYNGGEFVIIFLIVNNTRVQFYENIYVFFIIAQCMSLNLILTFGSTFEESLSYFFSFTKQMWYFVCLPKYEKKVNSLMVFTCLEKHQSKPA